MRIGIDARLLSYRRGMGNFVHELVGALAKLASNNEFILYVSRGTAASDIPGNGRFKVRRLGLPFFAFEEQISLGLTAMRDRLDILHCPANTGPLMLRRRTRLVLTIHDVMYLMPESELPRSQSAYQRAGRLYRSWVVPRLVRRASAVTTDSRRSADDVVTYLGIEHEGIRVVYAAPGATYTEPIAEGQIAGVSRRHGIGKRFVLALGAIDPRKNTRRIVTAFAALRANVGVDYQLVIAGLSGGARDRVRALADESGAGGQIVVLGFVPESDLAALYHAAQVFVYPSLYEGFGLPVLEAMACGTPVIASTAGSIPEIAGDAAILVDPNDTGAIAEALRRVVLDGALRRDLIGRGRARAAEFSWERAAREMIAVYEEAAR